MTTLWISLSLLVGAPPSPPASPSPTAKDTLQVVAAVDVIGALEDARTGTRQLQAFAKPPHPPHVRARAFLALARNGADVELLDDTMRRGLEDRGTTVRQMAVFAIGQLGDARFEPLLIEQVRQEPERVVVREIWKSLGRIGTAESLQAAQTSPRWYRPWAVTAAGLIARPLKKAPWEVPVIAAALNTVSSADDSIRAAALYSLSRGHFKKGPKSIGAAALRALGSGAPEVIREAARALRGQRFEGLSWPDLGPALQRLSPHAASWMVSGWKRPEAIPPGFPRASSALAPATGLVTPEFHLLKAEVLAGSSQGAQAQTRTSTPLNGALARWLKALKPPSDPAFGPAHGRRVQALNCLANPDPVRCLTHPSRPPVDVMSGEGRRHASVLLGAAPVPGRERLAALQTVATAWKTGDKAWLKRRSAVLKRALLGRDGPVAAMAADLVVKQNVSGLGAEVVQAQKRFQNNVEVAADLLKAVVALGGPGAKTALAGAKASKERSLRLVAQSLAGPKGSPSPVRTDPAPATLDTHSAKAARTTDVIGAVLRTEVGAIAIRLHARMAPRTVANFVALARKGYYDGVTFHRVVPGFVAQAGDPRGDGWGGPGYTIRCENNPLDYEVGTVGMALAGKDTGGSQWFITLQAQPHLLGTYTVFGKVVDGMAIARRLAQGDVIRGITIIAAGDQAAKEAPWTL